MEVLLGCKDDVEALWADSVVREMLVRRKVRLEDSPGLCVLVVFARVYVLTVLAAS